MKSFTYIVVILISWLILGRSSLHKQSYSLGSFILCECLFLFSFIVNLFLLLYGLYKRVLIFCNNIYIFLLLFLQNLCSHE